MKIKHPFTLGGEVTGRVLTVGSAVQGFSAGDLVMGQCFGAWQEKVLLSTGGLVKLPQDCDPVQVPSAYSYRSAWHALTDRAQLRKGETLLVLGASGGVGSAAVELGKLLGATVIAGASTDAKLEVCRSIGADYLVNYDKGAAVVLRARSVVQGCHVVTILIVHCFKRT
jgi:NADPH2:quinone reductase